jgi:hypothetical protein
MRPLMWVMVASLAYLGCEAKQESAPGSSTDKPKPSASAATPSAASSPSAAPSAPAVPPDAMTVPDLAGGFEAKIDKTVKLAAQFMNANSVKVDGKMTVQNIVLVAGKDATKPSIACVLVDADKPKVEGMKQYTPLVVEGKVRKSAFGDAQLVDCKILGP